MRTCGIFCFVYICGPHTVGRSAAQACCNLILGWEHSTDFLTLYWPLYIDQIRWDYQRMSPGEGPRSYVPFPVGKTGWGVGQIWSYTTVDVSVCNVMPAHRVGALSDDARLTSVAYIGTKSGTERPRKTKIGSEVGHVTPLSRSKCQRSSCRRRGHIVAASRTACLLALSDDCHEHAKHVPGQRIFLFTLL